MYNIIPIIIIIASLAAIVAILVRKVPNVSVLDVDQLPEEKQLQVKKTLIRNKLERVLEKAGSKITEKMRKWWGNFLSKRLGAVRNKMLAFEAKYHQTHKKMFSSSSDDIAALLEEARALKDREDLTGAEKKYIEVIEISPQDLASYRGLADVYLMQGNCDEARETLEHVLKLVSRDKQKRLSSDYINLGLACRELKNYPKACTSFKQALSLEPRNPRILDLLCETSIMIKDKKIAKEAWKRLRKVNPDNQKLGELREKIEGLEV